MHGRLETESECEEACVDKTDSAASCRARKVYVDGLWITSVQRI